MGKAVQFIGFVMVLQGVSGTIDRLFVQPFMGGLLNLFNRVVIPRLDFLTGYEVYANLSLAVLGAAVLVAADRIGAS
ncbi:hypothetical protein [Streptosporangium sandarakinum]|uniref:Uncharacterized protein n=1 Tax=Streptosporangium sandarakinum TaxID=1260955 RepID=A0A852UVI9_9ACTN|nr:hypothetical protein [Streptosporangium sandarakinum]NYF39104.1 hypothetical protein [Streptosporangium sandarakinum]